MCFGGCTGGTCFSGPSFDPVEWGQGVSRQKNTLFNRNIPGGPSVPPIASLLLFCVKPPPPIVWAMQWLENKAVEGMEGGTTKRRLRTCSTKGS